MFTNKRAYQTNLNDLMLAHMGTAVPSTNENPLLVKKNPSHI